MGGLLFPGVTRRYNKDEYFEITERIYRKLSNLDDGFKGSLALVRAFGAKSSFGDADFCLESLSDERVSDTIKRLFNPEKIIQNGNIYSFPVEELQVDLVITKPKYFESSTFYYSDSPSGNAVGKLAHFLAVSFGFDGLYYTLRDDANTYKLGKIQISTDMSKICEFFGLDYQKKMTGFQEEKDIFDWIVSSKYFDARLFSFEAMNHRSRIRDLKHPDYHRLLEYVNKSHKEKIFERLDRKSNLIIIDEYFKEANLLGKISELQESHRRNCELSAKFNGNTIMEATLLRGKELGAVLGAYKQGKDWFNFLESNTESDIRLDFMKFYNSMVISKKIETDQK